MTRASFQTNINYHYRPINLKLFFSLMADMEKSALSEIDFQTLLSFILPDGKLNEKWMGTIEQVCMGRLFVAKQCIELLQIIGDSAPFEKNELAAFLYENCINKDSFQLVINSFSDSKEERENLIHRLSLNKNSHRFLSDVAQCSGSPTFSPAKSQSPYESPVFAPEAPDPESTIAVDESSDKSLVEDDRNAKTTDVPQTPLNS